MSSFALKKTFYSFKNWKLSFSQVKFRFSIFGSISGMPLVCSLRNQSHCRSKCCNPPSRLFRGRIDFLVWLGEFFYEFQQLHPKQSACVSRWDRRPWQCNERESLIRHMSKCYSRPWRFCWVHKQSQANWLELSWENSWCTSSECKPRLFHQQHNGIGCNPIDEIFSLHRNIKVDWDSRSFLKILAHKLDSDQKSLGRDRMITLCKRTIIVWCQMSWIIKFKDWASLSLVSKS